MKTTGTWLVEDEHKTHLDEVRANSSHPDFVWVHLNSRVAFHAPKAEMAAVGAEILRASTDVTRETAIAAIAGTLWSAGMGSRQSNPKVAGLIVDFLIRTGALAVKES
jgi:hypothetical protein